MNYNIGDEVHVVFVSEEDMRIHCDQFHSGRVECAIRRNKMIQERCQTLGVDHLVGTVAAIDNHSPDSFLDDSIRHMIHIHELREEGGLWITDLNIAPPSNKKQLRLEVEV